MEKGTYHIKKAILPCCTLYSTGIRFSMASMADFIKLFLWMKIAVTVPVTKNRMLFESENTQTRQGETPEVQPHGVALPS